jgi:hypothetical protein
MMLGRFAVGRKREDAPSCSTEKVKEKLAL